MQKNYFDLFLAMKLELDVWHHLLDVYTKFQIDIPKHVKKALKTSKNPKHAKIIAKNSENMIFAKKKRILCQEVYNRPPM